MRIFFDTNVLVAAFATRGLCADLFRYVLLEHRLVITPIVLEELTRVLKAKFEMTEEQVAATLDFLKPYEVAPVVPVASAPAFGLRDPSDEEVLASALAAGAELVVSGDRDLTEAAAPLRIVTPRGLWELLRSGN